MPSLKDEPGLTTAALPVPEAVPGRNGGPGRVRRPPGPPMVALAVGAALTAAVVLRFTLSSPLWLDEALTVNIAGLPLSRMAEALRHDGAPPLYYGLLHGWMALVGDGDTAARALSGVFAVACLPLMWLAGRRLGGRATAWAAALLLASSPFAIRFATEARMYSLLMFLTLLGYLALAAVLDRPRPSSVAGLAVVSGLLALTHYWAFYLIGSTVLALAARWLWSRGPARRHCLTAVLAIGAGGVLFVPWLRSFVFQLRHTGAPWAPPAPLSAMFDIVGDFTGGSTGAARILLVLALLLAAVGLFGRSTGPRRLEIDLRTRPDGRGLALVTALTLFTGLAAGLVLGSAFASRYASVALVPFLLLVALGLSTLGDGPVRAGVLAAMVVAGLVGGAREATVERSQAGVNAAAINQTGGDGDVVAFCPDQLGPSTNRLLDSRFDQLRFPDGGSPRFVDWVDYADRNRAANPTEFAQMLDARAGDSHDVYVVWEPGYRSLSNFCEIVDRDLGDMRPRAEVLERRHPRRYGEVAWVMRYPGSCRLPLDRSAEPVARPGGRLPRSAVFTRPAADTCSASSTRSAPPATPTEPATDPRADRP